MAAYLRIKLDPYLEAEVERFARAENRRSTSDMVLALLKEGVQNRRRADTAVRRLVEILKAPASTESVP